MTEPRSRPVPTPGGSVTCPDDDRAVASLLAIAAEAGTDPVVADAPATSSADRLAALNVLLAPSRIQLDEEEWSTGPSRASRSSPGANQALPPARPVLLSCGWPVCHPGSVPVSGTNTWRTRSLT